MLMSENKILHAVKTRTIVRVFVYASLRSFFPASGRSSNWCITWINQCHKLHPCGTLVDNPRYALFLILNIHSIGFQGWHGILQAQDPDKSFSPVCLVAIASYILISWQGCNENPTLPIQNTVTSHEKYSGLSTLSCLSKIDNAVSARYLVSFNNPG